MSSDVKITFMRHGRSRADDEEVQEGRYDSPLTEAGRDQARARAEELKLRGIDLDSAMCSRGPATGARARRALCFWGYRICEGEIRARPASLDTQRAEPRTMMRELQKRVSYCLPHRP